jgi:hypothetical protein
MKNMTIDEFIETHRAELVAIILKKCPNVRDTNDDTIFAWVMNDEQLYRWALAEKVDLV